MEDYTTEREDFHSLFNIAIVYYNEKKYQDSYKYLKKAEKIDPTNHKLIFYLGMLYFNLKKYKEAREYLRKYIKKHKKELYPLIIIAKILIQEHRIAEAKKILIRISKKKQGNISPPDNPFLIHFEAFKHLGICYYLKERWETACKWFKKAYHIKYNDTELIKYYTKALIKLNEISEVESIYNKYIEEHDYDKKLAEEIADFYLEKDPNKSLLIYRKLYNKLELSIDAVIKFISLLIKNKENIQEASMVLDKYIVKFPDNISLRLKKGIVERMSGNYINAYEYMRSAIEIDLSNIEAWFELGETYKLAGNYSDAKYCYKKVIELFDNIDSGSGNINDDLENINYVLSSYIHLGKIAMNNSKEQARKYFEKAIKLNPSDSTAYLYLLKLLYEQDNLNDAIEIFRRNEKNITADEIIKLIIIIFRELNSYNECKRVILRYKYLFPMELFPIIYYNLYFNKINSDSRENKKIIELLYEVCHTTKFQEKKRDYNKKPKIIRKIADKTGIPLTIFSDLLLEIMKNKAYLTKTYYEAIYTGIYIETEKLEYFIGKLTHLHSEIESNLSETNFFEMEELISFIINILTISDKLLANRTLDALSKKMYKDAYRVSRLLEKIPIYYKGFCNLLGELYINYGLPSQSLRFFNKALSSRTPVPQTEKILGIIDIYLNRKKQAIERFRKLIEENPGDLVSYLWLYSIYSYDNSEKAEYIARKIFSLDIKKPEHWVIAGKHFLNMERYDYSITSYLNALKLNPKHLKALISIADILLHLRRIDEAIVYYKKYLEISPDNYHVCVTLGNIYYEIGEYDNSKNYFERALNINVNYDILLRLGILYLAMGNYKISLQYLEKAYNYMATLRIIHYYLGLANFYMRNYKVACKHFEISAENHSGPDDISYYLGISLKKIKKTEKAIDCFIKTLNHNNINSEIRESALFHLLEIYFEENDPIKSGKTLKKLLSDKENKIALENLINYYLENEDMDSAIEFSEKIYEITETLESAIILAKIYYKAGKYIDAIKVLDSIKNNYPKNIQIIELRADIIYELSEKNKSKKLYEKAIRLGSSRFKTFYLLAELEMEAGNLDSAVNYYKICLEIIQNNDKLSEIPANNSQFIDELKYNILKHLAEIYFIQKRYKAAISTIEKMRDIHIFDSKILRILAESYWKIGEAERAVETYNEILKVRPDDTSVIIRITEILIEEDKFSQAQKFIERLLNTIDKIKANKDIENYKSRIYYLAGLLFFKKNIIKKAIKYLEGYISTNKWDTKALKILAECYEKAGYQKRAVDIYSMVIETQVSKNKTQE